MKTKNHQSGRRNSGSTRFIKNMVLGAIALALSPVLQAGGTLTPQGSSDLPAAIRSHHADVVIQNGFARTEVTQVFANPNPHPIEALYAFPLPETAALSEVIIQMGERELRGEVLAKEEARQVYQEEKQKGNDAGLAEKESYLTYTFRVAPIPASSEVTLRFVYYQAVHIDSGVGRYVYPLEDGGTDEQALSFWTTNDQVEGTFSVQVELKSAWPVTAVRAPGLENLVQTETLGDGHYRMRMEQPAGRLNKDFVVYYKLADDLPGRIEVIPHRADPDGTGTFMMVVTPGIDLKPLTQGADYIYVLDISGSMKGKFHTLVRGVSRALGEMRPEDRFRVITFNNRAREVIPWTNASAANVQHALNTLEGIGVNGGTNLYAGLDLALKDLDDDRAASVVLVTDGVTNTGIIDPKDFDRLMTRNDVRIFGFVMGNSANWPLMKIIADASGGFTTGVSNEDDIVGQIILAKSKITYESLHHASFSFAGTPVHETTGDMPTKIYRGQQLVVFGRYDNPGQATVTLKARMTGEDKTYRTAFELPAVATDNPEIERLWAMQLVEQIERLEAAGHVDGDEARQSVRDIGVSYQIVTDQTSMVILTDEAFAEHGIDRRNLRRADAEAQARAVRASQPIQHHRVDNASPAFPSNAPRSGSGNGGGAFGLELLAVLILALVGWHFHHQSRRQSTSVR